MRKQVAVIGSDGEVPAKVRDIAEEVGRIIARRNCVLICGGRGGVMEAACRGAKEARGTTVGILPVLNKDVGNKFLDIAISTSYGYARNTLVVSAADIVVAIHGSVGTLSEIALALNYDKPVYVIKESGGVAAEIKKIKDERVQDAIKEISVGDLEGILSG
ncbi:MAG: TIGR00725 family protein [Candidatus Altiarchaeota archaeon]|nr:TIGR00725 family protein [Candidatus Altiarchaeota archaeon]